MTLELHIIINDVLFQILPFDNAKWIFMCNNTIISYLFFPIYAHQLFKLVNSKSQPSVDIIQKEKWNLIFDINLVKTLNP
jgi:hypothetical protein